MGAASFADVYELAFKQFKLKEKGSYTLHVREKRGIAKLVEGDLSHLMSDGCIIEVREAAHQGFGDQRGKQIATGRGDDQSATRCSERA